MSNATIILSIVILLCGCTKFKTLDADHEAIYLSVVPDELGGCVVIWTASNLLDVSDNTIKVEKLPGK